MAFLLIPNLCAQTQFTCDFEDAAQNQLWQLNPGPHGSRCVNIWHIGTGANNGGRNGIYISADGGKTPSYILDPDFTTTYIDVPLDAGVYELSFDWKCGGNESDGFYVAWVPADVLAYCHRNGIKPDFVDKYALPLGNPQAFNSKDWSTHITTFSHDGTPHRLAFFWINGEGGVVSPSAQIDNINIIPDGACKRPRNLDKFTIADELTFEWNGTADEYDFRCRRVGDTTWYEATDLPDKSFSIYDVEEGVYEVYVRSKCAPYHSAWSSKQFFVFFEGRRCIDYMWLEGNEKCEGYYGAFGNTDNFEQGFIDNGYMSADSRHTVHYDKTELDPRTGNELRTVPEDEIASVRLGNWMVNAQSEMLEYSYHIDRDAKDIFLLKYAVVLQDPGHPSTLQPSFQLRILDEEGYELSAEGCTEADFIPGSTTDDTWNKYVPPLAEGQTKADTVVWHDWAAVGIPLEDYQGKDIKIQLITRDCGEIAHYGYAYFAMGCEIKEIKALSCGRDMNNDFRAPSGFNYRWYKASTPDVVYSYKQTISVPQSDNSTYYCECSQITNPDCKFTLSARSLPRIPLGDADVDVALENCELVAQFTDRSRVVLVDTENNDTIDTDDVIDSVMTDFGDGSPVTWERSPRHVYAKPGTYRVKMTAFFSVCDEVHEFDVVVPEIENRGTVIRETACFNEGYKFGGYTYYESGMYVDSVTCDYIDTLYLTVLDVIEVDTADVTCTARLPYQFGKQQLYESGLYTEVFESSNGCDSTVNLTLTVNTSLDVDVAATIDVCDDDEQFVVPYTSLSGDFNEFSLTFADEALAALNISGGTPADGTLVIPVAADVVPGKYKATFEFGDAECGDCIREVLFVVNYPSSLIAQRWNDVLGVRKSDYNFVAFQWFVNDAMIDGATGANLYVEQGLDTASLYKVRLTGADGVTLCSCPLRPQHFADIEVSPTIVFSGERVEVKSEAPGVVSVYDVNGLKLETRTMLAGGTSFVVGYLPGVYLVEVVMSDGTRVTEKLVVR